MSRIRSIKPEFWTSEQVMECSTNARLLFIGLWNFCDDAGRHPAAPKQIKALVFPADPFTTADIAGMLDELSTNGLIHLYTVDGKEYFEVDGWHHQKIDRPQKPKFPAPSELVRERSSNDRDGTQNSEGNTEGKERTETIVSGADAPNVFVLDARQALWSEGLAVLSKMTGKPAPACKSLLGRWLKATNDDAQKVRATILRAAEQDVAEAVSWIEAALAAPPTNWRDDPLYRNVQ